MREAPQLARAASLDESATSAAVTLRHPRAAAEPASLEELAEALGLSKSRIRTLFKGAREKGTRGGRNGVVAFVYLVDRLPLEIQRSLLEWRASRVSIGRGELPLFPAATEGESAEIPQKQVTVLPEEMQREAEKRFSILQPLLEFRRRGRPIKLADGSIIKSVVDFAKWHGARQNPAISRPTLLRWLHFFEKGRPENREVKGLPALADPARKDKGVSRIFGPLDNPTKAGMFLQKKWLREELSGRLAWESLRANWSHLGEGEAPSYTTALNYLYSLPRPLKTLAHEGAEKFTAKEAPFILRDAPPAMDWWIADHRQHDVIVQNDLFREIAWLQAIRLWLTAIFDWGSRALIGYVWAPTPSSRTISSATRMAIDEQGFPRKRFYFDNGKDFKRFKADLDAFQLSTDLAGLLGSRRIRISSALPKHPRSKPIESYFVRWAVRFDPLWKPAYCGNRPERCPIACREAQKHHQEFLAGRREKSPLPTAREFVLAASRFADEYNDMPLSALGGKTPNQIMEEQCPERTRQKVDPRTTAVLFWERDVRVVQQGGCVRLDGMQYEPDGASLGAMHLRSGRAVLVARDPYDLGRAIAVDPETGAFIGGLAIQERIAQDPENPITRDQVKASARSERAVKRAYGEWLRLIDVQSGAYGWKTEREQLVERAIANGTDGFGLAGMAPRRAPGAVRQLPAPRPARQLQPAFVSDAVAQDAEIFREIELED